VSGLDFRRAVAQLGSALEWGSRGRWFESSRPDHWKGRLGSNAVRPPVPLAGHQKKCEATPRSPPQAGSSSRPDQLPGGSRRAGAIAFVHFAKRKRLDALCAFAFSTSRRGRHDPPLFRVVFPASESQGLHKVGTGRGPTYCEGRQGAEALDSCAAGMAAEVRKCLSLARARARWLMEFLISAGRLAKVVGWPRGMKRGS
jgi:hypothetical protein